MAYQDLTYRTFDWLRFPLALMVVYIHNFNVIQSSYFINWGHLEGMDYFNILRVYGSLVLTHIAVPLFFIISGHLFFRSFDEWNWKVYFNKLERRFNTLLVPYSAWITIAILIAISLKCAPLIIHHNDFSQLGWICDKFGLSSYWNSESWNSDRLNWLGCTVPSSSPYLVPMWFIRDLMVMIIMSPVIYKCLIEGGKLFIGILFLSYISLVWPFLPGFDIESVFFFVLGGYISLYNTKLTFIERHKFHIALFAMILSVVLIFYYGHLSYIGNKIYPFWVILGVMAFYYICRDVVSKYPLSKWNKAIINLKGTSFFIFAFHTIILTYVNRILKKTLPDHFISYIIIYLVSPLIVVTICVATYKLTKMYFPRLSKILSGR